MTVKESVLSFISSEPARRLAFIDDPSFDHLSEIRLRADKPLLVKISGREFGVLDEPEGGNILAPAYERARFFRPAHKDIAETVERMSRSSLYAFESALRMGYMTLPGGHRAGVAGQAVQVSPDKPGLRTVTHIASVNLRVAHTVKGCADEILPGLFSGSSFCHTLIISPPACGKTTLLRDIIRQISDGGLTVGLVDERSEVAGCYRGVPQNDVGLRTDVLDGCPKAEGMIMLLRAMSPDVIAVDELGGERDARAVADVLNAGVKLLCTAHGRDVEDLKHSPMLKELMARKIFERYVVLAAPGKIAGVYGGDGSGGHVD